MLFSIGFLVTFVAGGVTGVMLASPTLDFHVNDTYFVVADFHYVMGGAVVFAMFAALYFWWPKFSGGLLREGPARGPVLADCSWASTLTFFPQHFLGLRRHAPPRRRVRPPT